MERIPTAWAPLHCSNRAFHILVAHHQPPRQIHFHLTSLCERGDTSIPPNPTTSCAQARPTTAALALTAPAQGQAWGRWPDQHRPQSSVETFYTPMDISGLIQSSYDSRTASSAPLTRTMAAPHYMPHGPYSAAPAHNMVISHPDIPVHHQPFSFNSFPNANINILVPGLPGNYMHPSRAPGRLVQPGPGERRSYAPSTHQSYVDEFHSHTPPIKSEPLWSPSTESPTAAASRGKNAARTTPEPTPSEINFDTEVDTLMKAIQAKSQNTQQPQKVSPVETASRGVPQPAYSQGSRAAPPAQNGEDDLQDEAGNSKNGKRRYHCQLKNCGKSFYQKTHLDIHERAHTGYKPYVSDPRYLV